VDADVEDHGHDAERVAVAGHGAVAGYADVDGPLMADGATGTAL
jgi:hypothetical protein